MTRFPSLASRVAALPVASRLPRSCAVVAVAAPLLMRAASRCASRSAGPGGSRRDGFPRCIAPFASDMCGSSAPSVSPAFAFRLGLSSVLRPRCAVECVWLPCCAAGRLCHIDGARSGGAVGAPVAGSRRAAGAGRPSPLAASASSPRLSAPLLCDLGAPRARFVLFSSAGLAGLPRWAGSGAVGSVCVARLPMRSRLRYGMTAVHDETVRRGRGRR